MRYKWVNEPNKMIQIKIEIKMNEDKIVNNNNKEKPKK